MKTKSARKKKISAKKGSNGSVKTNVFHNDPVKGLKRRRKDEEDDNYDDEGDYIESSSDEDEEQFGGVDEEKVEEEEETAAEKRRRLALELLQKRRKLEAGEEEEEEAGWADQAGARDEREGKRDTLIAKILQQEQMEESGRLRKAIASRVQEPGTTDGFQVLVKHRQSVTAVTLSEDDLAGFSASKDGSIVQWDVDSGKTYKYLWPSDDVLKSHGTKAPQGRATRHSVHVLALAVSSDGRYLASGGLDRHVHLWDVRTHQHVQAFPGHKGPVSCLVFRQGTSELFSGSFDRSVKIWNAEDRTYMSTLFGHQSEVLTIDCLRKERVLTVGRDRTMHLFKVPEESQLVFRASVSSLESGCFIGNDEFLSGSGDGSIEQWNILRKKPVHIVKNAHTSISTQSNGALSNGHIEHLHQDAESPCSSVQTWVSSVSVCRNSDLAASGAGNGSVRLWGIERESKGISPLFELPLVGFVNSLAFAKSGRFLVAGVGQEPRLGRWGRIPSGRNGVALHSLKLS